MISSLDFLPSSLLRSVYWKGHNKFLPFVNPPCSPLCIPFYHHFNILCQTLTFIVTWRRLSIFLVLPCLSILSFCFRFFFCRREAYTCWPQNTGAEEFNYGSRIDHILFAGSCLHQEQDLQSHNFVTCHVKECDILTQYKRWKPGNSLRYRIHGCLFCVCVHPIGVSHSLVVLLSWLCNSG